MGQGGMVDQLPPCVKDHGSDAIGPEGNLLKEALSRRIREISVIRIRFGDLTAGEWTGHNPAWLHSANLSERLSLRPLSNSG